MKKSRERCSLFSSSWGREKFSLEILSNSYAFSLIFSFGFFFLFRSGNVREYHHIYQCLKIDGPWFLKLTSTFSPSCLDSLAAHATRRRWTAFSQMIFFHHVIEQAQWLKTPKNRFHPSNFRGEFWRIFQLKMHEMINHFFMMMRSMPEILSF